MCLPAFFVISRIEGIGSGILLDFRVSMGQISVIVLTLVPVVRPRFLKQRVAIGDRRLSQLKLSLIAAIFHQTALDSFHLSHARCQSVLVGEKAFIAALVVAAENFLIGRSLKRALQTLVVD